MYNRSMYDSGVVFGASNILGLNTPTGTGVTPAQAADLAAPLLQLLAMFPALDEYGKLDYRVGTSAMIHTPQLVYGPDHPLAGQLIWADRHGGADWTRYDGIPAPHFDMNNIDPGTLERLVNMLTEAATAVASAT